MQCYVEELATGGPPLVLSIPLTMPCNAVHPFRVWGAKVPGGRILIHVNYKQRQEGVAMPPAFFFMLAPALPECVRARKRLEGAASRIL